MLTGQEESGLEQNMARDQAPQGGPKGIPTATVAGGMQQHGAGATAREQALLPEQAGPQQATAMDTEDDSAEREGAQEHAAEVLRLFYHPLELCDLPDMFSSSLEAATPTCAPPSKQTMDEPAQPVIGRSAMHAACSVGLNSFQDWQYFGWFSDTAEIRGLDAHHEFSTG